MNSKKIYRSASLTLYSSESGYLICQEMRRINKDDDECKDNLYHLIGGKVKDDDRSLLSTAIREFVEELRLDLHLSFSKKTDISSYLFFLWNSNAKIDFFDWLINPVKNMYHRFFIITLDKLSFPKRMIFTKLPIFYERLSDEKPLTKIEWIKFDDYEKNNEYKKSTRLLKEFMNHISSKKN